MAMQVAYNEENIQEEITMEKYIRTAREEDLPRILEIYAYARDFMAKTGNPNQWGNHNPPKHQLQQDIRDGNLFVVTEGEIGRAHV